MLYRSHRYLLALLFLVASTSALQAIEEKRYNVNGTMTLKEVEQQFKSLPDAVLTKHEGPQSYISIEFPSPEPFSPEKGDLFLKMETKASKDQPGRDVVIADPKTGRVFYLNGELKVIRLDLLKPWMSKEKLKPIQNILSEDDTHRIVKKSTVKKEVKK